jgi:hypothetical protein
LGGRTVVWKPLARKGASPLRVQGLFGLVPDLKTAIVTSAALVMRLSLAVFDLS